MLHALIATLSLLSVSGIEIRAGAGISLDGRMDAAEWADAVSLERDLPRGKRLRLAMKRTGPWLAIGMQADAAYAGETIRLYVADPQDPAVTALFFGIGNPAFPPLLWRRGPGPMLQEMDVPPECPRACRMRLDVARPDGWSGELLVRLGALGIGRGDLRSFRAHLLVGIGDPENVAVMALPESLDDPFEVASYTPLTSPDGWGADETWAPVPSDVSLEFDDNELLYHLYLEHDSIELKESEHPLLISTATRPRDSRKILRLQRRLEEARDRNPGLPQWTYYLARLMHEANRYDEAGKLIDALPAPVLRFGPVAALVAEHDLDIEEFDKARAVIRAVPWATDGRGLMSQAIAGSEDLELERQRLQRDEADGVQNPRVRFDTRKGSFIVELFEDDAPNATRNFIDLVLRQHYYDGLRFHSVIGSQFAMIGDPRTREGMDVDADQPDGPAWRLKPDDSPRPLLRGYLATVPVPEGGYHGSQIVLALSPQLRQERRVAVFGRVISGQDVLESLDQGDVCEQVEVIFKRNHSYDALPSRDQ